MDFVKYTFNPVASDGTAVDLIPTMTDGFVYTVADVTNDDGTITRTLSCEDSAISGLTKMQFGQDYNSSDDNPTNESLALLSVDILNVSTLTNCNSMFRRCTNVTSINTENFNTSNVTSMYAMFHTCSSLTTLDLSNFDTSKVTTMNSMFFVCSSLATLDVSNFDTSNVTNMSYMFSNCSSLTTLDVSNFDTSKVTTMSYMFNICSLLTTLDLSNFNTSNVINMYAMFSNCSSLTALDLSNFNTSKVQYMSNMFQHCSSLATLDVSNFDTSKATNISYMFSNCSSLTTLDLSNFDTSKVTTMYAMFSNCSSLTVLDVSNFDTSQVQYMNSMFHTCSSLTTLDLSNFNTSKVQYMSYMFANCSSLTTLDLSNFNTSNVTAITYMFNNCSTAIGLLYCSEDTITALANAVTSACDFYITSNNLTSPNSLVNFIEYREEKKVVLYLNPETQTWEKPVLRQWDSIEKHSDGKYYYHKRSGEVVLNGDKVDCIVNNGQVNYSSFLIGVPGMVASLGKNSVASISDLFNVVTVNQAISNWESEFYYHNDSSSPQFVFSVSNSKLSTQDVAGFKAWLQNNPTTVVYQLAQEEVYECTSLDLITYENQTSYIVDAGAISPISTLKVHNNISNVVSILQEKVSLLETKFTEMFKFMLSGDYQSLAFSLYPSDFATTDAINEVEEIDESEE